jgi:hypothetical protein
MSNFSSMRLGTLLAGVAFTALIGFNITADAATGLDLVPENVGRGLWFGAAVSWFGHIAAICRDSMLKQLNARLDSIAADIGDYGDRRETDGRLAGMRTAATVNGNRPHLVQ